MIPDLGVVGGCSLFGTRRTACAFIEESQLCEHAPFRAEAASCLFATPRSVPYPGKKRLDTHVRLVYYSGHGRDQNSENPPRSDSLLLRSATGLRLRRQAALARGQGDLPTLQRVQALVHQDAANLVLLRLQKAVYRKGQDDHGRFADHAGQVDDCVLDVGELQERNQQLRTWEGDWRSSGVRVVHAPAHS